MTVQAPEFHQNAGSIYTAEQMRRVMRMLSPAQYATGGVPGSAGVRLAGDLAVSQNGSPNMSVNIAGGEALMGGTESTTQGYYYALNDATLNRTIATADATNPRNDLVSIRIRDAFYSGTFNDGDVIVTTGTPAPSPVDPTPPIDALVIARVRVGAGVLSILNANITDLRQWVHGVIHPGSPTGFFIKDSTGAFNNLAMTDAGAPTFRALATATDFQASGATGGQIPLRVFAQGTPVLTAAPTLATTKYLLQPYSFVGTTNGSALLTVTHPTAFPTGVLSVTCSSGDIAGNLAQVQINESSHTLSGFTCNCLTGAGAGINNTAVRVNVIAVGW